MFPEGMSTVVHAGQGPRNKAKVRAKIIIPNKASCCCYCLYMYIVFF